MENKTPENKRIERIEEILSSQLERRNANMLENHAQTIVVFVILAVLSWVGYSILLQTDVSNKTNVTLEVLKNDVAYMKEAIDKASNTLVSKNEFSASNSQMQKDIADNRARLRLIEINYSSHLTYNELKVVD